MRKFAAFIAALLTTSSLVAATDGTLSLSPAVVMLRGSGGQSTTQTLTITNTTSRDFEFDLVAQDVVVRDGKRVMVRGAEVEGSIAATAVFSRPHVVVPAGQSASVEATVTLPVGTHQRAVALTFRGTNTVMSGKVPMTASLATLLTFTASNSVDLAAGALAVTPQSDAANLAVSSTCTNSGSEPLVAKGVMAVLDAHGALVGRAALPPHRFLPGETASLGAEYPGELGPGAYRVLLTYEYEGLTLTRSADVVVQ